MAIDFPNSPTNGQIFTSGGASWKWDGTKWISNAASDGYLPLTGGTLTGALVVNGTLITGNLIRSQGTSGGLAYEDHGAPSVVWSHFATTGSAWLNHSTGGAVIRYDSDGSQTFAKNDASLYMTNFAGTRLAVLNLNTGNTLSVTSAGYLYLNAGSGGNINVVPGGTGNNLNVTQGNAAKPGGGVWGDVSDERTKQNIADYTTGLDAVLALRPVSFEKNGRGGTPLDGKTYVGLVANEAREVMPEMVSVIDEKLDPEDDHLSEILTLEATALIYALVNAVKELKAQLDELRAALPPGFQPLPAATSQRNPQR